jgi:hypothetical protein
VREGLVVQEWTASATHAATMRRGDSSPRRPPPHRVGRHRRVPFADGLIKRKDVHPDSVSILRQLGLLV